MQMCRFLLFDSFLDPGWCTGYGVIQLSTERERFIKVECAFSSGSDSVDRSIIPAFRAGDPGSNPGRSMLSHALMLFSFFCLLIEEKPCFKLRNAQKSWQK